MNAPRQTIPYANDLNEDDAMLNTRHGVFYPRGFNVVAYPDAAALDRAWTDGWLDAVKPDGARAFSSSQMKTICDRSNEQATTAATIAAAELKQIEIFLQIADRGGVFLIVDNDAISQDSLDRTLESHRPVKALRYGLLMTEELIPQDDSILQRDPLGSNEQPRN